MTLDYSINRPPSKNLTFSEMRNLEENFSTNTKICAVQSAALKWRRGKKTETTRKIPLLEKARAVELGIRDKTSASSEARATVRGSSQFANKKLRHRHRHRQPELRCLCLLPEEFCHRLLLRAWIHCGDGSSWREHGAARQWTNGFRDGPRGCGAARPVSWIGLDPNLC